MKSKFLFCFFLFSIGVLNAQDTIRSLIISEARLDNPRDSYIEITNVGNEAINLSQFKVGELGAYQENQVFNPYTDPIIPREDFWLMLPDVSLEAGKSLVIKNNGYAALGRLIIHMPEGSGDSTEIVSSTWKLMSDNWSGRSGFYIEQHINETDSVTIDQVGGVFDRDGKNSTSGAYAVAGVAGATATHILVRKFIVKSGNPDF